MNILQYFKNVWRFYHDGFTHMTWGRTLWVIILLKLFVIFVVLRIFFFKPALGGLNNEEKSERVSQTLKGGSKNSDFKILKF